MSKNYEDRGSLHTRVRRGGCESKPDLVELVRVLRTRMSAQNHPCKLGTFLIPFEFFIVTVHVLFEFNFEINLLN